MHRHQTNQATSKLFANETEWFSTTACSPGFKMKPECLLLFFSLSDRSLCRPFQEKWLLLSAFAKYYTHFFFIHYWDFFPFFSLIHKRTFFLGISDVFSFAGLYFSPLFLIRLLSLFLHFSLRPSPFHFLSPGSFAWKFWKKATALLAFRPSFFSPPPHAGWLAGGLVHLQSQLLISSVTLSKRSWRRESRDRLNAEIREGNVSGYKMVEERQREERCTLGIHRNSGNIESDMHKEWLC